MDTADPAAADAEPFSADGGRVGVVVSHGFTGTPASMRPWAQHLADAGSRVRLPLLPGHGGGWRTPTAPAGRSGTAPSRTPTTSSRARCDVVVACGLSMGGTLVTRLAQQHPDVAPAWCWSTRPTARSASTPSLAPYISWLCKSRPADRRGHQEAGRGRARRRPHAGRRLRLALPAVAGDRAPTCAKVTAPVLMYRSREDHVVDPLSAQLLKRGAVEHHHPRGRARGQLPRGHAGQRRADDLRRQRGVHPLARRREPGASPPAGGAGAAPMTVTLPRGRGAERTAGSTTACARRPTSR